MSNLPAGYQRHSHLLDEFRFQLHGTDTVDLAVDVMVTRHDSNVLHLGAYLDHQ